MSGGERERVVVSLVFSQLKANPYVNTSIYTDSPTHLATEKLNRTVVDQWPMENSIGSLKSVMQKIKSIASPEGSLVIGKDHEGRKWTSLLRL